MPKTTGAKKFRASQLEALSDPQLAPVQEAMKVALDGIDAHTRTELTLLNYLIHAEVKGLLNEIIDHTVEGKPANIAHAALADTLSSLGTYVATILAGKALDTINEPESAEARTKINNTFRTIQEVAQSSLSTSLPQEHIEAASALRVAVDRRVALGANPQDALRESIESGEVVVPDRIREHLLGEKGPELVKAADDDEDRKTGFYL